MSNKDAKSTGAKQTIEAEKKRELLKKLLQQEKEKKQGTAQISKKEKLNFSLRLPGQLLPLSFAQEALWFVDKINPEQAGYNTMLPLQLLGSLDKSVLYRVLEFLQQRHEVLRSSFVETDENVEGYDTNNTDKSAQVTVHIHDELQLPITEFNFTDDEDSLSKLGNLIQQEMRVTFDLSQAPLYRILLIKMSDTDHRLVLTIHHVISDGWSTSVLYTELCQLYKDFAAGLQTSLAATVQYVDYALAQRDYLTRPVFDQQLKYWKLQLNEAQQLEIPKDNVRPSTLSYQGRCKTKMFSEQLSNAIRGISRQQGVTVFVTMLSVFNLLMHRYSGQNDIVIGTPLMIRNSPELERIVGLLVNMIVLRTTVKPAEVFTDFLKSNRKIVLDAQDNSDLPFDSLVKTLKPQREANANPFFQIVFAQDMAHSPELHQDHSVEQLSIQVHDSVGASNQKVTRFDIEAYLKDDGAKLGIEFVCNQQMFDESTVVCMLDHYLYLIEQVVRQPHIQISQLKLLNEKMIQKVLIEWNETATDYPRENTLAELFEQQVQRHPDAIALIYKQQQINYEMLNKKANQLAHYLIDNGLQVEEMVALSLDRSIDLIISILAITKAGGVYVPLDSDYPEQRLAYMLEDINARVLLTHSELLKELPAFSQQTILLDQSWSNIEQYKTSNPVVAVNASNLLYVMYTSGSTGKPKGVCVEHSNVCRLVKDTNYITMGTEETFLLAAPVSFDASTMEIWGSLLNGGKLVIYPEQHISTDVLAQVLIKHEVTTLFLTSALFNQMVEHNCQALAGLKQLLTGGEMLSAKHAKTMLQALRNGQLIHVYGPTESTTYATYHVIQNDEVVTNYTPIGKPISNTTAYILDQQGVPVPPGITGELYIGGDGLARNYLNQTELTTEKFIFQNFNQTGAIRLYRTGDLARFTNEGDIVFIGRCDNQITLRSDRVELGEIETLLAGMNTISQTLVMLREDISGDKRLVAYLIQNDNGTQDISSVREYCQNNLPAYMVPSAFVFLDKFPINKNGKIDQKLLPAPDTGRQINSPFIAAKGKLQQAIANIWKEILNIDEVGIEDNFFDLGGHSLLLVKVHKKIKQLLDKDIPIVTLFQHPTIKSLSAVLQPDVHDDVTSLIDTLKNKHQKSKGEKASDELIAVIGLSGRFPGAGDIQQFWQNLIAGKESIKFFSEEELRQAGVDENYISHPDFVAAKGYLDNADQFDAQFFGFSPRDADFMDPQHRLFLMLAWEAMEHANYDPDRYDGNVGVFAGCSENNYWFSIMRNKEVLDAGMLENALAAGKDFLASRVAYKLNLRGPAITVQTACSTSLVAVHQACRSIIDGECDIAMAGGVSIGVPLVSGYIYTPDSIASPDGHCRAFDESAAGTVGGDGGGIVVLKRLSQALEDGDNIHAVVRGSAINNDGSSKVGYTAPSVEGQSNAIATAIVNAGIEASSISYIETHGTGTNLGDPIEIQALKTVFQDVDPATEILLGSLKSNIGHLDAAAGVSSFIKTVLALKSGVIPPSLHFNRPNPELRIEESPFKVNTSLVAWRQSVLPARAGVSSFGIGGTNAHIILEQPPHQELESIPEADQADVNQLIILSAKNKSALNQMTENLISSISENKYSLNTVAFTLQSSRARFKYNRLMVAKDLAGLDAIHHTCVLDIIQQPVARQVVFMFSGQGSQHIAMGSQLYQNPAYTVFQKTVDECLDYLQEKSVALPAQLFTRESDGTADDETLAIINQTRYAQPALFIFEVALAKQLMAWGVQPSAMIGHSIGEYAAAHLAGVLSLFDALSVVIVRARLMHSMAAGSMLAVPASSEDCARYLEQSKCLQDLSVATINTPDMTVVSGADNAIEKFQKWLQGLNVDTQLLHTSHAFHSQMMAPMLGEFREFMSGIQLNPPCIPYISNISGDWIKTEQATDSDYYAQHIRNTVNFSQGLEKVFDIGDSVLLEVGPGQVLKTLAERHSSRPESVGIVACSPRMVKQSAQNEDEEKSILFALGWLHASGIDIDWRGYHSTFGNVQKVDLPTYPFQTQRYWIEPTKQHVESSSLERIADPKQWFYNSSWNRLTQPVTEQVTNKKCWLFFTDESDVASQIIQQFDRLSDTVITVKSGSEYSQLNKNNYQINPKKTEHYGALIGAIKASGLMPEMIVHSWMMERIAPLSNAVDGAEILNKGFYSLVYLYQALLHEMPEHFVKLALLSTQLQDVTGTESLVAEKCMAMAPIKVIPMESSFIQTRLIDVDISSSAENKHFIEQIVSDLRSLWTLPVIAYRGQYRWSQSFQQMDIPEEITQSSTPITQKIVAEGNYVIVGGAGQIGLELATALSSNQKINLHLISRSQLPAQSEWDMWLDTHPADHDINRIINRCQSITAQGSAVYFYQTDATDEIEMEEVLTHIENTFSRVNAVISCMGSNKQTLSMEFMDSKHAELQFNDRIKSLKVLGQVLNDRTLDFCVVTSSLASVMGVMDFVSYTAAHQYIDAFVSQQNKQSKIPWLCINWDNWLITEPGQDDQSVAQAVTKFYMKAHEGRSVFLQSLQMLNVFQIFISSGSIQQRIDLWSSTRLEEDGQDSDSDLSYQMHPRPDLEVAFVAPNSDAEKRLATIWQEVLGLDLVGIHDNFFELGGDSVLNIQITSKARQQGLILTPKQVFEFQTIHQLARVSGTEEKQTAQQTAIQGEILLTPVQRWFFERNLPNVNHFNLSTLLRLNQKLELTLLRDAMVALINHHDVLRMKYVNHQQSWQQINGDVIDSFEIENIDLYDEGAKDMTSRIEQIIDQAQRSLDISRGPVFRVVYITSVTDPKPWLIFIAHHLIIDVVSWQIILEDLQTAYRALENNRLVDFPKKSTSFQQWSRQISDYAQTSQFLSSVDYWKIIAKKHYAPFPHDHEGENTIASTGTVFVELTDGETRELLTTLPTHFDVGINDLLVFALTKSVTRWIGQETLLLNMEGHGREYLADDIDVSRTVGWFTSIYPVDLTLTQHGSLQQQLKSVQSQIKEVPMNGLAYGMARYLNLSTEVSHMMQSLPDAQISFLYMGQSDQAFKADSLFSPALEKEGEPHDPMGTRAHLLEINSIVKFGKFMAGWSFSNNLHKAETIQAIANEFINVLKELVHEVQSEFSDKTTDKTAINQNQLKQNITSDNISQGDLAEILRQKNI